MNQRIINEITSLRKFIPECEEDDAREYVTNNKDATQLNNEKFVNTGQRHFTPYTPSYCFGKQPECN